MSDFSKYSKRELIELLETQEEMVEALRAENRRLVPADELTHLYHDLRVRQDELEIHNQELRLLADSSEQARHRYATLHDQSPSAFVSVDSNGVIYDLNQTAASFLRTDRSILIGKPFSVFLREGQRQKLTEHLHETLTSGGRHCVDLALNLRVHHPVYAQFESVAVKDERHGQTLAWTNMLEITTRKLEEDRLRTSEKNLSDTLENTDTVIWSIDSRYEVLTANGQYRGLREHFVEGSGAEDAQFLYDWKLLYDRALAGENFRVEKEYLLDDQSHTYQFDLHGIRHDDAVRGATVYGRDVTEPERPTMKYGSVDSDGYLSEN